MAPRIREGNLLDSAVAGARIWNGSNQCSTGQVTYFADVLKHLKFFGLLALQKNVVAYWAPGTWDSARRDLFAEERNL